MAVLTPMRELARIVARRRLYSIAAVIATVILGLASRKYPWLFPSALGKYPGDVLWAQMVYWSVALVFPSTSIARVATYALAISYADEISQLYQAPWINQIRATTCGHLVLGSAFSWLDLLSYTVGVGLCAVIEVILGRILSRSRRPQRNLEYWH
jgi:hypothetical protein